MKRPIALVASWWRSTVDPDIILKNYRYSTAFESFESGFPSTLSSDNLTDTNEESLSVYNSHNLHHDSIKLSLEELSRCCSVTFNVSDEIQWNGIRKENLADVFKNTNNLNINVAFLWAAFLKRYDLLQEFLDLGAELSFYEHTYGLTGLHIMCYIGCEKGVEYFLAQRACYANLICKCYYPLHCAAFGDSVEVAEILLEKGANIDSFTNDLHCNLEGVLHCAVRAGALKCLKLFCDRGANVNQLDSSGRTPIHLAAELGLADCLFILVTTKNANINLQTKEKLQTALHLAALKRHSDCIDILLDHGGITNITDYTHHTPLHIAAKRQCNESVKLLLKKGKANPNLQDAYQRTALHFVVSKASGGNLTDIVKTLIRYGADVNAKDSENYTPLHLAARQELSDCVETLILSDADITAKCKSGYTALGIITRKTPSSIDAIKRKLDESITFNSTELSCKEPDLQIDFTCILQYSHPKEVTFLNTLLDEGHKDLLLHPVCMAFLHLKWNKIKKFYIFRSICLFLMVISMSAYVLMGLAKNCYNFSKNITVISYEQDKYLCLNHSFSGFLIVKYPFIVEIEWYIMIIFTIGMVIRRLCGIAGYSSVFEYIFSIENLLDWGTIFTAFLISCVFTGRTYIWQNHVSAFGVLLAWTNFLYTLGQFPFFGTYIAMYSSVQGEFAKLLLVFSCLLLGFTVSFCVLFPESEVFSTIYIGFITVLVMAIGEMNLDLITKNSEEEYVFMLRGSMEIIYAAFVTCVTIILLNLLVGIAVHDIKGLKKSAKLSKLMKLTKLISCIERALLLDFLHRRILGGVCRWTTQVFNEGCCIINVKVHHHTEKILPKDILQSACEVARKHKKKQKSNFKKLLIRDNQNCMAFTRRNNNNHNNNSHMDICDNEIKNLKNDVMNLRNDIADLKKILECNQKLTKQILELVSNHDE